jgi:predicted  nucleic acid-binding Zn-ribbon protein
LKDKIENLRRGLAYTEDVLNGRINDLIRQLTDARVRIGELESKTKLLESENKLLAKQAEKANKTMKEMMPTKDHEEALAHYR